jgi:hypothetical protein
MDKIVMLAMSAQEQSGLGGQSMVSLTTLENFALQVPGALQVSLRAQDVPRVHTAVLMVLPNWKNYAQSALMVLNVSH